MLECLKKPVLWAGEKFPQEYEKVSKSSSNMKFKDKENNGFYKAKKGGFQFTIAHSRDHQAFYVVAKHLTKDIRLNTLWIKMTFNSFDLAVDFCEKFNYKDYDCIGDDVNRPIKKSMY